MVHLRAVSWPDAPQRQTHSCLASFQDPSCEPHGPLQRSFHLRSFMTSYVRTVAS